MVVTGRLRLELWDAPTATAIRASVAPDNAPSLAVAAKTGFTEIRGTNEDGELVLVRPLP